MFLKNIKWLENGLFSKFLYRIILSLYIYIFFEDWKCIIIRINIQTNIWKEKNILATFIHINLMDMIKMKVAGNISSVGNVQHDAAGGCLGNISARR